MHWKKKSRNLKSMPKNKGDESKTWEEDLQAVSVYDFLYRDTQRIDLLLAQFEGVGTPREHTRVAEESKSSSKDEQKRRSVGYSSFVPWEKKNSELSRGGTRSSGSVTYDQSTINTLTLLDHLYSNSMIQRDVTKAGIGQIVLTSGILSVFDYSLFESIYKIKAFRSFFRSLMDSSYTDNPEIRKMMPKEEYISLTAETARFNRSLRFYLASERHLFCGSMDKDGFAPSPESLLMDYRNYSLGEWFLLGTLDQRPQEEEQSKDSPPNPITGLIQIYHAYVHNALGKPEDAYALTPLMIFREVKPIPPDPDSDAESRE